MYLICDLDVNFIHPAMSFLDLVNVSGKSQISIFMLKIIVVGLHSNELHKAMFYTTNLCVYV